MSAEYFYEEFKAALRFLDIPWGCKESVAVLIVGDRIVLKVPGKEAHITLPTREK